MMTSGVPARKTGTSPMSRCDEKKGRAERNARAAWGGIAAAMERIAEAVETGDQGRVVVTFRYRRKGVCGIEVENRVERSDGD